MKRFISKVYFIFVITLIISACNTTANSKPTTSSVLPTFQHSSITNPQIMFFSNRDNIDAWYIMDLNGSNLNRLAFPQLGSRKIVNINWDNGLNAFLTSLQHENNQIDLFIMDIDGTIIQQLTDDFYEEGIPSYSENAALIAFVCVQSDLDICTVDSKGQNFLNITNVPSRDSNPVWSKDGERIIFTSNRSGVPSIWSIKRDGTDLRNLSQVLYPEGKPSLSIDGSKILFQSQRDLNWEIYLMDASDGSNPTNLTNNPGNDTDPIFSPDGSYIAFFSDRNSGEDIYVMTANGTNLINVTNTPDIREGSFAWSPDNSSIIFSSPDDQNSDIFLVKIDGSDKINLTSHPSEDVSPMIIGQ